MNSILVLFYFQNYVLLFDLLVVGVQKCFKFSFLVRLLEVVSDTEIKVRL